MQSRGFDQIQYFAVFGDPRLRQRVHQTKDLGATPQMSAGHLAEDEWVTEHETCGSRTSLPRDGPRTVTVAQSGEDLFKEHGSLCHLERSQTTIDLRGGRVKFSGQPGAVERR